MVVNPLIAIIKWLAKNRYHMTLWTKNWTPFYRNTWKRQHYRISNNKYRTSNNFWWPKQYVLNSKCCLCICVHKIHMWYLQVSTLLKVTLIRGCFSCFWIVQMVTNRAKRLICPNFVALIPFHVTGLFI